MLVIKTIIFFLKGFLEKSKLLEHKRIRHSGGKAANSFAKEPTLNASFDDGEDDINNPFKLKKCSIRLRKLWYIEKALDLGYTTVWMPPKGSDRNICRPKPIW